MSSLSPPRDPATSASATRSLVDRVERRLVELAPVLRGHAGGVELLDISREGSVTLRFTGMCTGCRFRPLTMAATLRPALLDVPGVTEVAAEGARISAEAEERLAHYLSKSAPPWLPTDRRVVNL